MDKIVLHFDFISNKSVEVKLILIDKKLLSKEKCPVIVFNSYLLIYSSKTFKKGINSFRLPTLELYNDEKNRKSIFNFSNEQQMYNYLKKLNKSILECNEKFRPFVTEPKYNERNRKMIMSNGYWII